MFILFLLFMSLQIMQNIYSASDTTPPTTPTSNISSPYPSSDREQSPEPRNPYENNIQKIEGLFATEYEAKLAEYEAKLQAHETTNDKLSPKVSPKFPQSISQITNEDINILKQMAKQNPFLEKIISTIEKYRAFKQLKPWAEYITPLNNHPENCEEITLIRKTICSVLFKLATNPPENISNEMIANQILKETGLELSNNINTHRRLYYLIDAAKKLAPLSGYKDKKMMQRVLCYALYNDMKIAETNDKELNSRKRERSL